VYAVTDLGTVGGDYAAAMALNEWGHVVGYSRAADGRMRAFHWAAGTMRDLGTYRGRRNSYGHGLNDAGVAVGLTLTAADRSRGIVWTAGRARDLGALAGGESAAEAARSSATPPSQTGPRPGTHAPSSGRRAGCGSCGRPGRGSARRSASTTPVS
jgi:probable HAF family extracellular repeat protein